MRPVTPALVLTALTAVLTMSLVPVLVRATSANEITIALARLFIALAIISPAFFWHRNRHRLSRADWQSLAFLGAVFGVHWLTYFYSIKAAGASMAAIAISTYGVQLLLLNLLLKRQRFRPADWAAVLLCFTGAVMVVPAFTVNNAVTVGLLWGLFSALLYASLPLLHQRISHVPTLTRTWGQFFFAAVAVLPFAGRSNWALDVQDWGLLLALGIVCTVIAHSLWVKASTELPAVVTSVVYYLYVPLAMFFSGLFLDEAITLPMLTGAALIIVGNTGHALWSWRQLRTN